MNAKTISANQPPKHPATGAAAAVALLWLLPSAGQAGGVVAEPTEAALRAAMSGGGTVTFACDGTIVLVATITNAVDTMLEGSGHEVIISGGNRVRCFFNNSRSQLTLLNLTIANGFDRKANGESARGGGIYNDGSVSATSCLFSQNQAVGDWTYPYPGGYPTASDAYGGAIYNAGILNVTRCTFSGNRAKGSDGPNGPGGGESRQPGNGYPANPGYGGAIFTSYSGSMAIAASVFYGNAAVGGTGGQGGNGWPAPSSASQNGGAGGPGAPGFSGAIGGSGSLVNCTVVSNAVVGGSGGQGGNGGYGGYRGGDGGGGWYAYGAISGGYLHVTNCTIAFNAATQGIGGLGGSGSGGQPNGANGGSVGTSFGGIGDYLGSLCNTLLASNAFGNCSSTPIDAGHNLSSDNGSGALTNLSTLLDTDPKLSALLDNGGPTLTMALLPGSPAIDGGNTAAAPATDQRGFPRPFGLAADIGALEVMPWLRINRASENSFDILASGLLDQSCQLLASSNLSNWSPIATNPVASDGSVLFHDNLEPGAACRFYRVVMP